MDAHRAFSGRKTIPKFVVAGLMGMAFFAGVMALQFPRFRVAQDASINLSSDQLQQQSDALALQLQLTQTIPALGFNNLVANWQFLSFLQYFGDAEARARTDYQASPEFFKVIIPRDPYFFIPYVFLSTSTSIYAAQPQTTVDLMAQGLTYLNPTLPPEAPLIWRYKAVDELLFLGNPDVAIQSYQTAADWADQSPYAEIQATGDLSRQTAAFIAENPDSSRTLVAGWSQILGQAVDQTTFNLAVEQIEALGGEVIRQPDGQFTIRMPNNLDK